jgi:outer membrane murein-binding lipoprotein Lpp
MTDVSSKHEAPSDAQRELLVVQKEKLLAEIEVLRRTTPLTESIKVFGSLVLGIGGAVAAVAGFGLAEVKAEKAKLEAVTAAKSRDEAADELKKLTASRDQLRTESEDLRKRVDVAQSELSQLSDRLDNAQKEATTTRAAGVLQELQQSVNAADITLRSAAPAGSMGSASLDSLVKGLYAQTAAIRGAAYEEILARFATSEQLIPVLLNYAEQNLANGNGTYNALVLLSRLDVRQLRSNEQAVRAFANKAKSTGPRTAERAEKLLARILAER